jgi:hypothetical protein
MLSPRRAHADLAPAGAAAAKKAFDLEGNMLGIDDPWIWGVYLLCILSALLCLIYGVVNWNREGDQMALEEKEEEAWEESEEEMQQKELGM